jgi:hypothetical protein
MLCEYREGDNEKYVSGYTHAFVLSQRHGHRGGAGVSGRRVSDLSQRGANPSRKARRPFEGI